MTMPDFNVDALAGPTSDRRIRRGAERIAWKSGPRLEPRPFVGGSVNSRLNCATHVRVIVHHFAVAVCPSEPLLWAGLLWVS